MTTLEKMEEFSRFPATAASKQAMLSLLNVEVITKLLGGDMSTQDLTCRVLVKLMPESTNFLRREGSALWPVGLQHPNATVRKTTLEILSDQATQQDGGAAYIEELNILPAVLCCVCDRDLKLYNAASAFLLKGVAATRSVNIGSNDQLWRIQ